MEEIKCDYPNCPTPKIYIFKFIPTTTIISTADINLSSTAEVAADGVLDMERYRPTEAPKEPNDYLVLYCDSNHKKVHPIYTPPPTKTVENGKEEES